MILPCKAILINRLQQIKTEDDTEFRFAKVLLVKHRFFSRKLIPYDTESGKLIIEMKHFHEGLKRYFTIDIESLTYISMNAYTFDYIEKLEDSI